jgi:hypothetical protein
MPVFLQQFQKSAYLLFRLCHSLPQVFNTLKHYRPAVSLLIKKMKPFFPIDRAMPGRQMRITPAVIVV